MIYTYFCDYVLVPIEYLDYDGNFIQSEFLGYSDNEEVWIDNFGDLRKRFAQTANTS